LGFFGGFSSPQDAYLEGRQKRDSRLDFDFLKAVISTAMAERRRTAREVYNATFALPLE
jgi:hypothetical protein